MGLFKFDVSFCITLIIVSAITGLELDTLLYLFPAPVLVGLALFDNAMADLPGYIMKHHKFILNFVMVRYISPNMIRWVYNYLARRIPQVMCYKHNKRVPSGGYSVNSGRNINQF